MELDVGIACGACDTLNSLRAGVCLDCGHDLTYFGAPPPERVESSGSVVSETGFSSRSDNEQPRHPPQRTLEEEVMEQARNYVCKECSTAVPSGHKFCGTCGAAVPIEVVELRIKYFGAMQAPGKARLTLIRGEGGGDGLSYMLQGSEHVAGREDGQILFPDDTWLSPRHANFVYESGQLVVRDEGSLNGIYVRTRGPTSLGFGDTFICGEQVFRIDPAPRDTAGPGADQTYFYASPRKRYTFVVSQLLTGGGVGITFCAASGSMLIGREECDINFPSDVYMSGSHAKLELVAEGMLTLNDLDSKNGSYVRVKNSHKLQHGDYLFLGRELLRVEMTG
jgi:pSer/pThr/pTyr-binding forkhead associated (FHA) protein